MRLKQHLSHQGGLLTALGRPKAVWAPETQASRPSRGLVLGAMLRVGPSNTSGQEDRDRSIISCGHELVLSDPSGTRIASGLHLIDEEQKLGKGGGGGAPG